MYMLPDSWPLLPNLWLAYVFRDRRNNSRDVKVGNMYIPVLPLPQLRLPTGLFCSNNPKFPMTWIEAVTLTNAWNGV